MNEYPSSQLIKGVAAILFSVAVFFILLMTVAMTPDPQGEINYTLFYIIELGLLVMFGYGINKLIKLEKFLVLCERTTKCWKKN